MNSGRAVAVEIAVMARCAPNQKKVTNARAFGVDHCFHPPTVFSAPPRLWREAQLELLRVQMEGDVLRGSLDEALQERVHRAAQEAAALAATTEFPLLMFPNLFHEKLDEARQRAIHQRLVLLRSQTLVERL